MRYNGKCNKSYAKSTDLYCISMFLYPVNMNMDITGFSFLYHNHSGNWMESKGLSIVWANRKGQIHI